MELPRRITIAGVGLIGGSIGLALKESETDFEITGFGTNPVNLDLAKERGAIDRSTIDLEEAVSGAELLIICTPVRTIIPLITRALPFLSPGVIITDVGSTKSELVRQAENIMPEGIHFIGGHPMAGSEVTGVGGATPALFKDAYYFLTPSDNTAPGPYSMLHNLIALLGARIVSVAPRAHDEMMAMISHMPHMLAVALVNVAMKEKNRTANENLLAMSAGGFRDMTRIAASGVDVWVDISLTNSKAIAQAIDGLMDSLAEIRDAVASQDEQRLRPLLSEASLERRNLPGTTPREKGRARLRVLMPDHPGVISNVALIVGEAGVNIVDLELLHLKDGEALLELSFAHNEHAGKAMNALSDSGYRTQLLGGSQ